VAEISEALQPYLAGEFWLAGEKEAFQAATNGSPLDLHVEAILRTLGDEDAREPHASAE
jgi:hypothetical protein